MWITVHVFAFCRLVNAWLLVRTSCTTGVYISCKILAWDGFPAETFYKECSGGGWGLPQREPLQVGSHINHLADWLWGHQPGCFQAQWNLRFRPYFEPALHPIIYCLASSLSNSTKPLLAALLAIAYTMCKANELIIGSIVTGVYSLILTQFIWYAHCMVYFKLCCLFTTQIGTVFPQWLW